MSKCSPPLPTAPVLWAFTNWGDSEGPDGVIVYSTYMYEGQPVESILGGRRSNSKGRKNPCILRKCWVMQYSVNPRCMKVRSGTVEIWMDSRGFCLICCKTFYMLHVFSFSSILLSYSLKKKKSQKEAGISLFSQGSLGQKDSKDHVSQQMAQPEFSHSALLSWAWAVTGMGEP